MKDSTALFLFDFDGTLVKGSLHNYIGERLHSLIYLPTNKRYFASQSEYEQFIVKNSINLTKNFLANDSLGWKNPKETKVLMKKILMSEHKIGIVSFNNYPEAVKYTIVQLIGKEDAEKIYIKSALPSFNYNEIQRCDKVPYILEAMRGAEITDKKKIILIDDDLKNILAADDFGIKTFLVGKKGKEYIDRVFDFLGQVNEEHGIFIDVDDPLTEPEDYPESSKNEIGFNPIDEDWNNDEVRITGQSESITDEE